MLILLLHLVLIKDRGWGMARRKCEGLSRVTLPQIMSPTLHMKISRNYLCLASIKAGSKSGTFPISILRHMLIDSETCMILCGIYHIVCNSF